MYKDLHLAHHSKQIYAKEQDPEYTNFGSSWYSVFIFLAASFILPILSWIRFLILAPLSIIHADIRQFVRTKASSMGISVLYKRDLPKDPGEILAWNLQEFATSFWYWLILLACFYEMIPWMYFLHWYLLVAGIAFANAIRALATTHTYAFRSNQDTPFEVQMQDSFNLDGKSPFNLIFCPVGLQYHALHHLFPTLPYHSLRSAHLRILKLLPQQSEYHQTCIQSIASGLAIVFANRFKWRASKNTIPTKANIKPSSDIVNINSG